MDQIVKHLVKCFKKRTILPYLLELRISHTCNLNCIHCAGVNKKINYKSALSLNEWIDIIKQAEKLGIKECLVIADKEPFTYPNIISLMREIKKHGIYGKTTTNGTLLNKQIFEALIEIGWDCVNISLDGPDPDSNDYIRGKGAFNTVIKNLKLLRDIKLKKNKTKPKIIFNTVIHKRMFEKIPLMIILASKLKVSSVDFHPLSVWFPRIKHLELTKNQVSCFDRIIEETKNLAKEYNISTNIDIFYERKWEYEQKQDFANQDKNKEDKMCEKFFSLPCYLPWYFISVQEDGRVNPCHTLDSGKENIRYKKLEQIWKSKYFNDTRQSLLSKKFFQKCLADCCVMQAANHLRLYNKLRSLTFS